MKMQGDPLGHHGDLDYNIAGHYSLIGEPMILELIAPLWKVLQNKRKRIQLYKHSFDSVWIIPATSYPYSQLKANASVLSGATWN